MPNEAVERKSTAADWRASQVYIMAVVCLVVGLAIGYLFRGSETSTTATPTQTATEAGRNAPAMQQGMPSFEQMKHMADVKAQPLFEKLKNDPSNSDVLFELGNIYKSTHQFREAVGYYQRASNSDPKNIAIRTELASCMYYSGDVENAITELELSLQQNPTDANALFNLGTIKLQGKHDANGALTAWQKLLDTNPHLSADRKAAVEKLIAQVKQQNKTKLKQVTR